MIFGFSYGPLAYEKSMQWVRCLREPSGTAAPSGLRRNGLPDQRPGRYSLLPEDHAKLGKAVAAKVKSCWAEPSAA